MGLGALVRPDVRVDRLAHDRVRELEPGSGEQRERDSQVGGAAASSSASSARRAASGRLAPSPSTAAARTTAVAAGGLPARRRSTAWATAAGPIRRTRAAPPASVAQSLLGGLAQQLLEEERVAAGRLAAGGRELRRHVARRAARSHSVAVAAVLSGRGRSTVVSGAAAEPASSLVAPSPGRVAGEYREPEPVQPGREVVEEPQRLGVGPVEVVDEQRDRRAGRRGC